MMDDDRIMKIIEKYFIILIGSARCALPLTTSAPFK